jgi:hypothetical protein
MGDRTCETAVTGDLIVIFGAGDSGDHGEGGRSRVGVQKYANNEAPRLAATKPLVIG